jgi:spore maturation protein SpmA
MKNGLRVIALISIIPMLIIAIGAILAGWNGWYIFLPPLVVTLLLFVTGFIVIVVNSVRARRIDWKEPNQ